MENIRVIVHSSEPKKLPFQKQDPPTVMRAGTIDPKRLPNLAWSFPDRPEELTERMERVYSGFRAICSDESFKEAEKDELSLGRESESLPKRNARIHRRMYVKEARKVLEKIRFDQHESFYLVDLSRVALKFRQWRLELPFIRPFFAVKSNPNAGILHTVAALGCGFDCASRSEIHAVLHTLALMRKHRKTNAPHIPSLRTIPHISRSKAKFAGNEFWKMKQHVLGEEEGEAFDEKLLDDQEFKLEVASRIIFTHSIKELSHIEYAKKIGVRLTVADNETELHKLHKFWPEAQILLRIITDDRNSESLFSVKFGATKRQIRSRLIPLARELGLNLVGVSFHAGSLSRDVLAFKKAIADAREVFDMAKEQGFDLKVLDVGGGWPEGADWKVPFEDFARGVRCAIDEHFFADGTYQKDQLSFVSEPGRYVVGESHALVASIVGFRDTTVAAETSGSVEYQDLAMRQLDHYQYYINDGIYGGLNKYFHEYQPMHIHTLRLTNDEDEALQLAFKGEKSTPSVVKKGSEKFDVKRAIMLDEKRQKERDLHPHHPQDEKMMKHKFSTEVRDEESEYHGETLFHSTIFGDTCDGSDAPVKNSLLPRLNVGDAIVFVNMGAYTLASSTHFNGFSDDRIIYLYTHDSIDQGVSTLQRPNISA